MSLKNKNNYVITNIKFMVKNMVLKEKIIQNNRIRAINDLKNIINFFLLFEF